MGCWKLWRSALPSASLAHVRRSSQEIRSSRAVSGAAESTQGCLRPVHCSVHLRSNCGLELGSAASPLPQDRAASAAVAFSPVECVAGAALD
eukprot:4645367-Alexandrium_andersonii.AAC.1